jgi:hypothetical protein
MSDDVVSRIDNLIPIDPVHAVPLVWNARNIDLQVLIDARNEIKRLRAGGCARNQGLTQHCSEAAAAHAEIARLRARVEVLEKALGHYANDYRIGHCARIALLEAKP